MSLFIVRSTSAEALTQRLVEDLGRRADRDPLAPDAVVVGTRAMERWLRQRIATERGVAAALEFPFPKQAIDGAMAWALGEEGASARTFWRRGRLGDAERWSVEGLTWRVLPLLRAHAADATFERVTSYLRADARGDALTRRELRFASSLADVLQRIVHERPMTALAWARAPAEVPTRHRWLAQLLADLGAAQTGSPAARHETLREKARAAQTEKKRESDAPVLRLFGLTALGDGERQRLELLSRVLDVHLYAIRTSSSATNAKNPIRDALGAAEQKLDGWITRLDPPPIVEGVTPGGAPDDAAHAAGDDAPKTRLGSVRAWIRDGRAIDAERTADASDDTLRVVSCHGPLRQVEELRDRLLAAFADDPGLEPRKVLVVTPTLEVYAPLVEAVFSQPLEAARTSVEEAARPPLVPAIPVSIPSLGTSRTNSVAAALLLALEVSVERVTASRLLAFFELEPVRRRFGLAWDDLEWLRKQVIASGIRWGLDAEDKAREDQPRRDENTVRFGLERLALGVLVPDEGELFSLPPVGSREGPITPLDTENPRALAVLGALAGLTRTITHLREEIGDGRTRPYPPLTRWAQLTQELLDELTEASPAASSLRASVDAHLVTLLRLGREIADVPVSPRAFHAHLERAFELDTPGPRTPMGAVHVASLESLPAVPFDVIAVLGLEAGSFPRGGDRSAWDPFARPTREGEFTLHSESEADARENDRHLLLQALLAARKKLWMFYAGGDPKTAKHGSASMPIEELIDALTRATSTTRGAWVTEARLQPWAAGRFDDQATLSFDARMARAATTREARSRGAPVTSRSVAGHPDERLPEEANPPSMLTLDAFAKDLARPLEGFLGDRLGIYLAKDEEPTPDREPLEPRSLDSWGYRNRAIGFLLDRLRDDPSLRRSDDDLETALDELGADLSARLRGEGLLPLQAGSTSAIKAEMASALVAYRAFREAGEHVDVPNVSLLFDGAFSLHSEATFAVRPPGGDNTVLQWMHASDEKKVQPLLLAHLHLLLREAQPGGLDTDTLAGGRFEAQIVGAKKGDASWLASVPVGADPSQPIPDSARATLDDLVSIWRESRRRPLCLFERTSSAAGAVLAQSSAPSLREALESLDDDTRMTLLASVTSEWFGSFSPQPPERSDRFHALFFPDFDPTLPIEDRDVTPGGFLDLAWRVWAPVHRRRLKPKEPESGAGREESK